MRIHLNNYEAILLDYLDGRLSADEVAEVLLFLERHPQIKEAFEGLDEIRLDQEPHVSHDFSALKKPEFPEQSEALQHLLIAELEGDLSQSSAHELEVNLKRYPQLEAERQLYASTRIQPDITVVYPSKNNLRKPVPLVVWSRTWTRVAAIFIAVLLIGVLVRTVSHDTATNGSEGIARVDQQPAQLLSNNNRPIKETTATPRIQNKRSKKSPQQQDHQPAGSLINRKYDQPQTIATQAAQTLDVKVVVPNLNKVSQQLAYGISPAQQTTTHFPDWKEIVFGRLRQNRETIESKTLAVVEDMNKKVGISIGKDSVTGRINEIQIAGLGLSWSQSK